jgi:hypothetical protein
MSSLFNRIKSVVSHIPQLARKIHTKGTHLARKVRNSALVGARKARHFIHDAKVFVDKVNRAAPIVSEVVDELTDIVPGIGQAKGAIRLGISGFNTISSLLDRAEHKRQRAQDLAQNPSLANALRLFS